MIIGFGITSDMSRDHNEEMQNDLTILLRLVECVLGIREPNSMHGWEREMLPDVRAVLVRGPQCQGQEH